AECVLRGSRPLWSPAYIVVARPICRSWLRQATAWPCRRAEARAGISSPIRRPITPITTSNSTSDKPRADDRTSTVAPGLCWVWGTRCATNASPDVSDRAIVRRRAGGEVRQGDMACRHLGKDGENGLDAVGTG